MAKLYKCPECGKKFKTSNGLFGHLRFKHGIEKPGEPEEFEIKKEEPEKTFGKDIEDEFIENLKFAGLVGGHWENKRLGIAKLFFAGEPTPERLFWAMKKAGANPLQTDLILHLWFGDGTDYNKIAEKAKALFEKKNQKTEEILEEGEEVDEEKLAKLIRRIKKEEGEDDIWKRVERIYALKALDKALGGEEKSNDLSSLKQLVELKSLFNDPNIHNKISELERKIADEREKTILETLIKTMGQKKTPENESLVKTVLEHLSKNQEALEKLKEKNEELRYQSMKEYLDKVISIMAEKESWDSELKKAMREEMTKTLKEKLKQPLGREKSKADLVKEVVEGTIDKIKEPVLRPIGEALAENIRKPKIAPAPDLSKLERQKKQLELIREAELSKQG